MTPALASRSSDLASDLPRRQQAAAWLATCLIAMPLCVAAFLLTLAFVGPPQALGLDPAWTEVLAWGFLHRAQWGRDLVFTYGPLGLFHPGVSYVSGAFDWYVAGDIALPAAFAVTIALLLHRAGLALMGFFAVAFACCFPRLPGDLCWALILVFGTAFLLRLLHARATAKFCLSALLLAPLFGALTLTKFSVVPIWVICVAALAGTCLVERSIRGLLVVLTAFPLAVFAAWLACGQQAENLPLYLSTGFEIAYGYAHAMGLRAPFAAEFFGICVLAAFVATCGFHAWRMRTSRSAAVALIQAALVAVLFWLSSFIRADSYHWPGFFVAMALLPFALLCSPLLRGTRSFSGTLVAVVMVSVAAGFFQTPVTTLPREAWLRIQRSLYELGHIDEIRQQREAEWQQIGDSAALPKIRERIGNSRVDMLTWQQGVVIVNGFNYAPRPVFQSYSAYTPKLARLNESYLLGDTAPDFIVFALDYSDGRFPASEDGLALIAMAKRYRPFLVEKGFLLLKRDATAPPAAAVSREADDGKQASLGADITLAAGDQPAVGFISIELNPFGKMYTLLFREPALTITVKTADGRETQHRLIRLTAATGFLLNPVVQSSQDWIKLYLSKPLPRLQSIRVDTETAWDHLLFQPRLTVALQPVDILHPDPAHPSEELGTELYPEFNVTPAVSTNLRIIMEEGQEAAFLQAPDSILFRPVPGNYVASATFGVQSAALKDSECAKHDPDGIGASLILNHAGSETLLWHGEIDPFHIPQDRGPQHFRVKSIDVGENDSLTYRVDPGRGGHNVSCDWSYVRDFVLQRRGEVGSARASPGAIFWDGFE